MIGIYDTNLKNQSNIDSTIDTNTIKTPNRPLSLVDSPLKNLQVFLFKDRFTPLPSNQNCIVFNQSQNHYNIPLEAETSSLVNYVSVSALPIDEYTNVVLNSDQNFLDCLIWNENNSFMAQYPISLNKPFSIQTFRSKDGLSEAKYTVSFSESIEKPNQSNLNQIKTDPLKSEPTQTTITLEKDSENGRLIKESDFSEQMNTETTGNISVMGQGAEIVQEGENWFLLSNPLNQEVNISVFSESGKLCLSSIKKDSQKEGNLLVAYLAESNAPHHLLITDMEQNVLINKEIPNQSDESSFTSRNLSTQTLESKEPDSTPLFTENSYQTNDSNQNKKQIFDLLSEALLKQEKEMKERSKVVPSVITENGQFYILNCPIDMENFEVCVEPLCQYHLNKSDKHNDNRMLFQLISSGDKNGLTKQHHVSVKFNGEHIVNSPFKMGKDEKADILCQRIKAINELENASAQKLPETALLKSESTENTEKTENKTKPEAVSLFGDKPELYNLYKNDKEKDLIFENYPKMDRLETDQSLHQNLNHVNTANNAQSVRNTDSIYNPQPVMLYPAGYIVHQQDPFYYNNNVNAGQIYQPQVQQGINPNENMYFERRQVAPVINNDNQGFHRINIPTDNTVILLQEPSRSRRSWLSGCSIL